MLSIDTLVIQYDPIEARVRFTVLKSTGVCVGMADDEALKEYENTDGLFTLEGQYSKLFTFIKENFEGKAEISLKIEVPQLGFNKRQAEFERFEERVKKFNKSSETKINLTLDINKVPKEKLVSPTDTSPEPNPKVEQPKGDTAPPPAAKPTIKVALVGKISSGKTELIEGLGKHKNSTCKSSPGLYGTTQYTDPNNNIEWYEIAGIEFGKENVAKATDVLGKLITESNISIVLYCLNAKTGKIEDLERDFIVDVKQKYPSVAVFGVITSCVDESAALEFANKVSISTKQTKVFTVLARQMRTKAGYLGAFGLEEISKTIFGV